MRIDAKSRKIVLLFSAASAEGVSHCKNLWCSRGRVINTIKTKRETTVLSFDPRFVLQLL